MDEWKWYHVVGAILAGMVLAVVFVLIAAIASYFIFSLFNN